jgi:hypothetical protein
MVRLDLGVFNQSPDKKVVGMRFRALQYLAMVRSSHAERKMVDYLYNLQKKNMFFFLSRYLKRIEFYFCITFGAKQSEPTFHYGIGTASSGTKQQRWCCECKVKLVEETV